MTYVTRDELLEVCRLVYDRWLTNAGGSNFSGRISPDSVLLTPTGNAKRTRLRMSPDHLLHVRLDGTVLVTGGGAEPLGQLADEAEWILSRPAIVAVELFARYPYREESELRALIDMMARLQLIMSYEARI